jgi:hypothetical protein
VPDFTADPDAPILLLNGRDRFTLRNAFEGIHIFGAPGSGKTSGSGQTIARAFLRAGMGGLVLCSKPSEVERWQDYAHANGRESSLFLFDEQQGFNFIEYALARYGMDSITNVIGILMRVLDDARKAQGKSGSDDSPFWDESITQILQHSIPVLYSAYGTVTVESILDFAVNAPENAERWKAAAQDVASNCAALALRTMSDAPLKPLPPPERKRLLSYWMTGEWQKMDIKTRSNVLSSLTSRLGLFRHGRLRDCFCGKTTVIPEMMFHGAIIVMAMPVQANETEGRLGQMVFKYMAQLAIESRNALPERRHRERPVFLWVDEAHRFISVKDEQFLAECRESRACCVFLSQGLPSYYAALGERETKRVDGLIGKFSTQIFHQNACHHTNEYASKTVGRGLQILHSQGVNRSYSSGGSIGSSEGGSHGTNSSQSRGSNVGGSRGTNTGGSRGTNSGESVGTNRSESRGTSSSTGSTRGTSQGGGRSSSYGRSGGSSSSYGDGKSTHGDNSGWNSGSSRNTSWSENTGSSRTESTNAGETTGTNASRSRGVNDSQSWGANESQSWGTNESRTSGVNDSVNWSTNRSENWGKSAGESMNWAEHMDNLVEPNYFATGLLAGGGDRIVTALWFRAGANFESGRNFMLVGFRQ